MDEKNLREKLRAHDAQRRIMDAGHKNWGYTTRISDIMALTSRCEQKKNGIKVYSDFLEVLVKTPSYTAYRDILISEGYRLEDIKEIYVRSMDLFETFEKIVS